MSEVDVGIVRIGLVRAAVRAEAQGFGQRPAKAEVGAARGAILGAFRNVGEHRHGTTQTIGRALGDDVDYPARRAGTVACRRGPTEDLDALDLLRRHPVAVAAGVAFAAPAVAHRVARADRFAVDQDQGVLRPHAADVDLPVVAALAAGTVAGEVDPGHGADDLGEIVHRRALPDVLGGDDGYPGACLSSCSAVPSTTSSPSWTTDSARSSSSSRRSSSARACPPSRLDEAKGRQRRDGRDGIGVHA